MEWDLEHNAAADLYRFSKGGRYFHFSTFYIKRSSDPVERVESALGSPVEPWQADFLRRLHRGEEPDLMAFPKGFSPHRHHPGEGIRKLTPFEESSLLTPCPHCAGPLVKNETTYSEYVHCRENSSLYIDPSNEADPFWRFKRPTGPRSSADRSGLRPIPKIIPALDDPSIKEKEEPHWRTLAKASGMVAGTSPFDPSIMEELEKVVKAGRLTAERERLLSRLQQKKESLAPKPVTTTTETGFPYARFRKLADAVQAAQQQGKVGSGYSLRRELMTARLWNALMQEVPGSSKAAKGVTALHLAFALVGAERATDDEREFYQEVWQAQMGSKLYPLPQLPAPSKDGTWHPQAGLALAVIRSGVPLWLAGEAGAGKTFLTRQIAKLCELDYVRLQGSRDRTVDDVIGAWGYDPAVGSVFRAGVVVETARKGGLLHIDEVSALPHEVTFELHAVLEGEPLTVLKNSGEVVALNERFRMVANDNSVGEGEQAAYVGLHSTNLAFRDRWAFLRVEPMPADLRKKLVLEAAGV